MMTLLLGSLLFAAPSLDAFKKEMAPLQVAVDGAVTSTGAQVLRPSRAIYVDGYGIVVSLEIAFEAPQGIFSTPKKPEEVRATVAQRRKDVQQKLTAFLRERIVISSSIGAGESLMIAVHVLNTNLVEVPNLPMQILFTVNKDSPQQVTFKEI